VALARRHPTVAAVTITISSKKLVVGLLAVLMIAVACYIAFLAGQTTRITEATAAARTKTQVSTAVERTVKAETAKRQAQVKKVKAAARKHEAKHVKRLASKFRKRLAREIAAARDAGYSSGQSVGFTSGKQQGVEEGIEEASDELTCSDDSDVDLPACWDW
jgi:predicted membrane metal-binding protein